MSNLVHRVKRSSLGSTGAPRKDADPKYGVGKGAHDHRLRRSNITNLTTHFETLTDSITFVDSTLGFVGLTFLSDTFDLLEPFLEGVVGGASGAIFISPKRPDAFISPIRRSS